MKRFAAQELECAKPKWIPVIERLPDFGVSVLAVCKDNYIDIIDIQEIECKTCVCFKNGYSLFQDSGFTHWMPLPEITKE